MIAVLCSILAVIVFFELIKYLFCIKKWFPYQVIPVINLLIRCALIVLLQTAFNYANLFYNSDHSARGYVDVILQEYSLRTETYCYFAGPIDSLAASINFFFTFI